MNKNKKGKKVKKNKNVNKNVNKNKNIINIHTYDRKKPNPVIEYRHIGAPSQNVVNAQDLINANKKHIDELESRMVHCNQATQSAIHQLRVTDTSQPVNIVYPPSQQTFTPLYKDYDPIDPTNITTEPLKKPKKFTPIHTPMEDIEIAPETNLFEHLAEPKIIKKRKN